MPNEKKSLVLPALRIGEREYKKETLTLGEMQTLKRHFGVQTFSSLDFDDPDVLVGLMYLSERDRDPKAPPEKVLEEIQSLDMDLVIDAVSEGLEKRAAEEAAKAADGPPPEGDEDADQTGTGGSSVTTRAASGTQS